MAFLSLISDPLVAIPWLGIGFLISLWVAYDVRENNEFLPTILMVGWMILSFFFSLIALWMYLRYARPKYASDDPVQKEKQFHDFANNRNRKAIASAIHCVAGDGLGIITAMAFSRVYDFPFWKEFWFEYLIGFLFGWLIFQYIAMRNMDNGVADSLWKGFRGEFFSMITVMTGMGIVMGLVTPLAIGYSPDPNDLAFWMFGALGLFVGFLYTYPMNYWLVSIGWKHGIG